MKYLLSGILVVLGGIAVWSAGPVWVLYTLYELFANGGTFWSTVGTAMLGVVLQLVLGYVSVIIGSVLNK